MKIEDLLKFGIEELEDIDEQALLKSRMLLSHVLGESREYLVIHSKDKISGKIKREYLKGINRLKNGEPIQYVVGKTEFYGFDFIVNKDVLIPQPDTEILVEEILENFSYKNEILDLCTGSGAIGICLKKYMSNSKVYSSDISKEALKIANKNAEKNEVDIIFLESDLFKKIYKRFDLIVSNPPYIERSFLRKLPREVKFEPTLALDGGIDGLDFYRIITKEAKDHLKENGILALEIGFDQKEAVIQLLEQEGYEDIYSKKDYGGNDRIVVRKIRKQN